jgi:hypothetical protein
MKLRICIFIFLIFNITLFSQENVNKTYEKYQKGITYYLSPDTTDFSREVLFICTPQDGTNEYSLALETRKDINVLVVRTFITYYWSIVWPKAIQNEDIVPSKIKSADFMVSKVFADKLKASFQLVLNPDPTVKEIQIYDGNIYYLVNKQYKRKIRETDFTSNKSYYKLIKVCEDISKDLENAVFNEKNHITDISELMDIEIK